MTHYETLGVSIDATVEAIRKSYINLSKIHHPDKNGGDGSKFKEINDAYNTLSDAISRQQYDLSIINSPIGKGEHKEDREKETQRTEDYTCKPRDINYRFNLTLKEVYCGVKKKFHVKRYRYNDSLQQVVLESKVLTVQVNKGASSGEMENCICIRGEGNLYPGMRPGNILLEINIIDVDGFEKRGLDIIYVCDITLKQALCGLPIDIMYLDDQVIDVNPDKIIIAPFSAYILKDKGLQNYSNKEIVGSLVVKFNIIFPDTLSPEVQEKLTELL